MAEKTTWWKMVDLNYLGSYSLGNTEGGYSDIVLTIKSVKQEKVNGAEGRSEMCMVMRFVEDVKPMIVNATNAKTIQKVIGSPYIEDWAGHKIQIGVEKVKAFGDMHDALRVRKFPPRVKTPPPAPPTQPAPECNNCHKPIAATAKMTVDQVVEWTTGRFGLPICAVCATKLIEEQRAKEAAAATEQTPAEQPSAGQKEVPANAD